MYFHLQPNLLHIMDQAAVLEDATKMEFYDVITSDIKDIWDNAYFMETMSMCQDSLLSKDEDWCSLPSMRNKSPVSVVIRDRLMTDAALGGPKPIKTEHSYSLLASSPPRSPDTPSDNSNASNNDSNVVCQDAVISSSHQEETHRAIPLRRTRITDLLEECFPVFSENDAPCAMPKIVMKEEIDIEDCTIKGEPISAPNSPNAPTSPSSSLVNDNSNSIITIEPHTLHFSKSQGMQSDSEMEEDDEEMYQNIDFDVSCLEAEQECQSNDGVRQLPPTPPSSASSDSETSASCSPEHRDSQTSSHVQSLKGLLTPRLYVTNTSHTHTTRRPINTPLISCQPKGSTGVLILTEEEKRTLLAEGYPIPTKLPLSKSEEKSLKKIRRKIKNKISAQESRRKKKEYMDNLERRVTILTNENSSYKDRLSSLEAANRELVKELNRLQSMLKDKSS